MHSKIGVAGFATLALFGLGCGLVGLGDTDTDTGTVNRGDASASPGVVAEKAPSKIARMGTDTVTLDGGLVVSVSKPTKFVPSAYSAGHERGNVAFLVSVTLENRGDEPFDLLHVRATAALGADGVGADDVWDIENRVGRFEGALAPTQKRTVTLAFSAPTKDTSKVGVTVSLGSLDRKDAIFEGTF